jgi:hypothetical protein
MVESLLHFTLGYSPAGFFFSSVFLIATSRSSPVLSVFWVWGCALQVPFWVSSHCLPISHPPAFGGLDSSDCTPSVLQLASVPNEVELPQIAVKIFAADIVVHADHAALHQSIAALSRIGAHIAPRVFLSAVVDGVVAAFEITWKNYEDGRDAKERLPSGAEAL